MSVEIIRIRYEYLKLYMSLRIIWTNKNTWNYMSVEIIRIR